MNQKSCISKINKRGVLLVFPVKNKREPLSLWSEIFPRKKMNWSWDESGSDDVADMWAMMKKLSASGKVVYSKWYQGRATFFSLELFTALLSLAQKRWTEHSGLSRTAELILETLESDSPLSTREVKKICELQGRDNERVYNRAMRELFNGFFIVGFGEVDDGAFPSLAVGSTRNMFEAQFLQAQTLAPEDAAAIVDKFMPVGLFRRYYDAHSRPKR